MRSLLLVALVCGAALSLSGCFWWSGSSYERSYQHNDGGNPFNDGGPLAILVVLLIIGLVILSVAWSNQTPPAPPPPPTPPAPPQPQAPATKSSKPRRPAP